MLKERKVEQIDWAEKGKCVGGYLLGIMRQRYKDGSTGLQYLVKRVDESRVVFRGATMLNLALSTTDVGKFIQVQYLGEDQSKEVREGMNRAKLFKVEVDDERSIAPHSSGDGDPGITDEDIPF